MPWLNGVTHELAAVAPLWRVSVADIARDGAFSAFPGMDRITVLLDGEGFLLRVAQHPTLVFSDAAPRSYPGDHAAECIGSTRPTRVLNVMTIRGRARATVEWRRLAGPALLGEPNATTFVLCVGGVVNCGGVALHRNDSALDDTPLTCDGTGRLLVVAVFAIA